VTVAANSATRRGNLRQQRRNGAYGAFFVSVASHLLYGGVQGSFVLAGFLCYRFSTPAYPRPRRNDDGGLDDLCKR